MRLKKLTIHNIASVADAEIDFSCTPLASSDVFLICGETGAGKTTILDSICLALFGSVPRLQLGGKAVFDEIKYNDERQMLRSGCGEGSVTLSFTGNDNIDYESCWSVRRARNKADGKFQSVLWTLKSKNLSLSKTTEVRKAVTDALSIDYEQFVRTSMLAQGEFTRFLKAEDSEKAVILKKLTGTDRFTRIGAEIYRLTAEKQRVYESLRERIAMEKILSPEEESALRTEYAGLESDEKELSDNLQAALARKTWLESLANLQKAVETSAAALETARINAASPEIADKRLKIKVWRTTEPLRQAMHSLRTARSERNDADDALNNLLPEFTRALGSLHELKNQKDVTEADFDKALAEFNADEWRDAAFSRYEEIITTLNSLIESKSDLSSDWRERRELQRQLSELAEKLRAAIEDFDAKDSLYKKVSGDLAETEKLSARYDFNALLTEQSAIQTRIGEITALAVLKETHAADVRSLGKEKEALSDARQVLKTKEEALIELNEKLPAAEQKYEEAHLLFETLRFTASTAIASARSSLKTGCQCPVCLQTVNALPPAEEVIKKQYLKAQAEAEAARVSLDNERTKISSLEAQITELRKTIADNEKKVSDTQHSVDETFASIIAKERDLVISESLTFESVKEKAESDLQKISGRIAEAIAARNAVDAARKARDNAQKEREKSENARNQCDKNITEHKSKFDTVSARITDTIAGIRKTTADFIASYGISDWKPESPFNARAFLKKFIAEHNKRQNLDKRIQSLKHQREVLSATFGECAAIRDSILTTIPEWSAATPVTATSENVKAAFTAVSQKVTSQSDRRMRAGIAITRHEADVRRLTESLSEAEAGLLPVLQELKASDINTYDKSCREADDAVTKAEAALKQNTDRLAGHRAEAPEIEEGTTVESLAVLCEDLQNRIAQINRSKGDISRRLQDNADARRRQAELIAQADEAHKVWTKWSRLNELLGSATGDKFNRIAQSFVLKALLDNANYYLSKLTDRYRLSGRDGQFIILVRDALNGNNERPVSTVSGGESFMASLALALALADAGTAFSSDILFIDEGFGTLSGEPLQRAVGMLRSLHRSSGKRVGIISHVEALRNEIPVQIRVSRHPSKATGEISVCTALPTL